MNLKKFKMSKMKKYLLSLLSLAYLADANSQTVQASIGAGAASNSVRVYLRPDITNPAVAISTLSFNIAIPAGITPIPALAVTTNNITGATWIVEPAYTEGGYIHYNIYNNQSLYTLNCAAGVEFQAMEVTFTGGPVGTFANTAHLVTLPDGGGGNGLALFYCTSAIGGQLNSNGQSLYYSRDVNVTHANGDSYRYTPPGTIADRGTFTSFARLITGVSLSSGTLPVTFNSFNANCHEKGAIVTWSTSTEQNSKQFDIQRSEDGTNWRTIGTVPAAGNSNSLLSYRYLDLEGGAALYRIRQIDLDNRSVLTAVSRTNCNTSDFSVALYPVPAKDNLTLVIRSDKDIRTDIQIIDMKGSVLRRIPSQIVKGNNTFNLVVSELPAGQYMLRSADAGVVIDKKFVITR
jgi:hypothetical protein